MIVWLNEAMLLENLYLKECAHVFITCGDTELSYFGLISEKDTPPSITFNVNCEYTSNKLSSDFSQHLTMRKRERIQAKNKKVIERGQK